MRAAVLVFMCIIGVTLALPSFRSKEAHIETRLAGLLEELLEKQMETRTLPIRSVRHLELQCEGLDRPCAGAGEGDGEGEGQGEGKGEGEDNFDCARNELKSAMKDLADIYKDRTQEELFSEEVINAFEISVPEACKVLLSIFAISQTLNGYEKLQLLLTKFQIGKHSYDKADWSGISNAMSDKINANACVGMMITHDFFAKRKSEEQEGDN